MWFGLGFVCVFLVVVVFGGVFFVVLGFLFVLLLLVLFGRGFLLHIFKLLKWLLVNFIGQI